MPSASEPPRVAVLTGGGGVLGGAMARGLAARGWRVALLGRGLDRLKAVGDAIRQAGGEALETTADVLDEGQVQAAADAVLGQWGRVDALVNAAGGNRPGATTGAEAAPGPGGAAAAGPSFFDMDLADVRGVMDLNWLGTLIPSRVFGRLMARPPAGRGGGGAIVQVSSMAGLRPLTKVMGYSSAKAAVESLTRWMAVHLAPAGVRVNALAPGFFLTGQNRYLLTDRETGAWTPRARKILAHTPMARMGEPGDLAGAVAFLAGDDSRFVTGVTLCVDGGFGAFGGV